MSRWRSMPCSESRSTRLTSAPARASLAVGVPDEGLGAVEIGRARRAPAPAARARRRCGATGARWARRSSLRSLVRRVELPRFQGGADPSTAPPRSTRRRRGGRALYSCNSAPALYSPATTLPNQGVIYVHFACLCAGRRRWSRAATACSTGLAAHRPDLRGVLVPADPAAAEEDEGAQGADREPAPRRPGGHRRRHHRHGHQGDQRRRGRRSRSRAGCKVRVARATITEVLTRPRRRPRRRQGR